MPDLCAPFQVIDSEMQSLEKQKHQRLTLKSQVDDMEGSIGEVRKRLSAHQKTISATQKSITSLETKQEQKRADRHSLLKSCKVGVDVWVGVAYPLDRLSEGCLVVTHPHDRALDGCVGVVYPPDRALEVCVGVARPLDSTLDV